MDLNFLKWQLLRGPLMRRVVLRAVMLVLAVIVLSLMQMGREVQVIGPIMSNVDQCPLNLDSNPNLNLTSFLNSAPSFPFPFFGASAMACKESENLTKAVFKELMAKNLLHLNARALYVGEGSSSAVLALRDLGLFDAFGVDVHPFFSLLKRRFVYELNFEDNHFDFVYSEDLDRVSVPALLVLEIERVLRPGGTGAMLVGTRSVGSFSLVIFKKRLETFASFEHFQLPANCPSIAKNKPFMKYIEPLTEKSSGRFHPELSYLPNFMNISSRNKLVYINIGAGEFAKTSVAKMSKLYRANHRAAFNVFVIDHKTSVLSSYVTDPGIHFVYHPDLAGDTAGPEITSDEHFTAPTDEEGFDFVSWFNETVSGEDFVILMMNAKSVELNILVELFKTGSICHVDELFLRCSDAADCKTNMCWNCMNLFKSLRRSGVYVHQWNGD
ncbi:UNVERIFIED_CONTAM: hypothetical protein Slati_0696000 [Sesamum latifolium]|uniref:Methyltransferase type 11 domain-containing protein n=1 Tax=Sesamum latifolium TaxID=2727402 RepID=A0AAW2Y4V2_9LAMI